MSKASEARWLAAYRVADSIYTQRDCGCLVVVMIDMPDEIKYSHDLIVREALAGRTFKRSKRGELPPLNCAEHQKVPA